MHGWGAITKLDQRSSCAEFHRQASVSSTTIVYTALTSQWNVHHLVIMLHLSKTSTPVVAKMHVHTLQTQWQSLSATLGNLAEYMFPEAQLHHSQLQMICAIPSRPKTGPLMLFFTASNWLPKLTAPLEHMFCGWFFPLWLISNGIIFFFCN